MGKQSGAKLAHGPTGRHIVAQDPAGFGDQRGKDRWSGGALNLAPGAAHLLESPEEIHRGGATRGQDLVRGFEGLIEG